MLRISRKKACQLIENIQEIMVKREMLESYFDLEDTNDDFKKIETEVDITGISNGFIAEVLHTILGYNVEVYGDVEKLFKCPCCGLRTLSEQYNVEEGTGYDICPYCNWEDDGTTDINVYTSINRGSIKDYRNKLKMDTNRFYISKWYKD